MKLTILKENDLIAHRKVNFCKGFTLAEVLITLGIIGVVAALTLPSLIQSHRKEVLGTRLAKFYSTLNQAISMSTVEHGPMKYWDFPPDKYNHETMSQWVEKYIKPHMNIVKIEPYNGTRYTSVYFADGSYMHIFNHNDSSSKFLHINFYPSKVKKIQPGKNMFWFFIACDRATGVETQAHLLGNTVKENLMNNSNYGCAASADKRYCIDLIRLNNWKVPDDYPVKL